MIEYPNIEKMNDDLIRYATCECLNHELHDLILDVCFEITSCLSLDQVQKSFKSFDLSISLYRKMWLKYCH